MAVRSYGAQTYPASKRELVIVHDRYDHVADAIERIGATVSARVVRAPAGLTLGELRNIGLDNSHGDVVAHLDGDDIHHPHRIKVQVGAYDAEVRAPVFLLRQLAYCLDTDVAFVRQFTHTFIHGSILHENAPRFRYPALRATEDTEFLRHWTQCIIVDNVPELYLRLCHQGSTSGHRHIMREYTDARELWAIGEPHAAYLRTVLESLPVTSLPKESTPAE
jgi:glycosyltransferase involved in cell wall biosynthesis